MENISRTPDTAGWRLGEVAASTTVDAGHYRSCPHFTFSGVTAAIAPNRLLAATK